MLSVLLPQLVVGERRLAAHLEPPDRVPAVADLRDAIGGRDAQQPDEPARRLLRMRIGLLLDDGPAVRADEADALVETGVELARDRQLQRHRIALLLRQRQRQRLRGVVVLQVQLRLQVVARPECTDTPIAPAKASTSVTDNSNHTWRINDMHAPRGRPRRAGCPQRDGPSLETILARVHHRIAPLRQPHHRIPVRTDATNTLPQSLGVEAEDGREIGPLAGRVDHGDQVVQHQRLGLGGRIVGQHHVRDVAVRGARDAGTHVDHAQLRACGTPSEVSVKYFPIA